MHIYIEVQTDKKETWEGIANKFKCIEDQNPESVREVAAYDESPVFYDGIYHSLFLIILVCIDPFTAQEAIDAYESALCVGDKSIETYLTTDNDFDRQLQPMFRTIGPGVQIPELRHFTNR